ncbi:DUF7347 domain-containing protein [Halosimplex marinum]|uniref:DUF7347 domain-containing protein n=1 Tax=Halosimplex marinum TaxID=3396620 RepID=UPI003F574005
MASTATGQPNDDAPEQPGRRGTDGSLPPPEALELATDEARRAILSTLWRADDAPLPFAALRRRSGVDGSGRFNYHLQRLRGRCVRRTDGGYGLTARGERFVAALIAVPALDEAAESGSASD